MSNDKKAPVFYIQDSRVFVNSKMKWWAIGGKSYTILLEDAQAYSKEDAIRLHELRHTDIPWPKAYVDARNLLSIGGNLLNLTEALADTGIVILKPAPQRKPRWHCIGCGRFLSEHSFWMGPCHHCKTDNRP